MKTITMDFDLYRAELKAERLAGAEVVKGLNGKLIKMIGQLQSYNSQEHEQGIMALSQLITAINLEEQISL